MPKVTEEYRVARRDEIADAALRAFRRKGFQATSMAEIIAESGLSAGAIYGHYPSKSAIVVEVAARVVDARVHDIERLSELTPMLAPPAIPRMLALGMLKAVGSPAIMVQLWGEGMTDPEVGLLATDVVERLRSALTQYVSLWHRRTHGTPADEADRLAVEQVPLFIATVQGYVLQASIVPDFDGEAYLAAVEKYLPR
ncbi:TetR/AcrR family transcriptional regulator [Cellulomonas sp. URHE0023]|uniref:TetR/AcrR family transcriptional regulator n=1 Tax=Cellulomonas sp. URHE0023 TaxID=1380354 RepID=UPI000690EB1E|nr:TetR/AcrR family transcriptional regulator [Cellulomonas sp. URHE0023]